MTQGDYKSWIGKNRTTNDTINLAQIAKVAATFDLDVSKFSNGSPLPPGWHWAFFPEITPLSGIGRDGHQALGEFLPPVTLPRRMWAAGDIKITKLMVIGETVTKSSTIVSVEEKTGRSGELVFVAVRHQFSGDKGADMQETHQIVYREAPSADAVRPTPALPKLEAHMSRSISASPVQLFRYSAITFNSHRIHYDVDFCRQQEGYDGLIIHGPLTATWLMDLAVKQSKGKSLSGFSFRAVSPLTHIHELSIHAHDSKTGTIELWACNHLGEVAMTATAELV